MLNLSLILYYKSAKLNSDDWSRFCTDLIISWFHVIWYVITLIDILMAVSIQCKLLRWLFFQDSIWISAKSLIYKEFNIKMLVG